FSPRPVMKPFWQKWLRKLSNSRMLTRRDGRQWVRPALESFEERILPSGFIGPCNCTGYWRFCAISVQNRYASGHTQTPRRNLRQFKALRSRCGKGFLFDKPRFHYHNSYCYQESCLPSQKIDLAYGNTS